MVDLKSYFHSQYQGGDSFIENVIKPIFGDDKYYETYEDVFQTFSDDSLEQKAENIGLTSITRLGYIDNGDTNQLDVFDITVGNSVRMKNNRVALQLLIRRIMSTYSSAFMVFHYNDNVNWDWRFSFCSKLGNNKEVTEAKRYTFMLGPNYSCRTAADNFQKLFQKAGNVELNDIVKAFDVEALSKEFFDKYKLQYEKFCNYIYENKNDRTLFGEEFSQWEEKTVRDYVKKLLGRIVFLHFIQKKGWLGVPANREWGCGDVQFMINLFKNASDIQKADYLDTVLEPLFSEALDTDRSTNDNLFDTGVDGFRNIKIPYLNGGLFGRESIDEPISKFPAEYFASLLEFLYEYNFTIDENDPNDAEMGIDPEMLGRIFENLLEDNKDKGAFYTPKEIVNYMCRESLIAYLTSCVIKKNGDKNPKDVVQASVRQLLDNPDVIVPKMSPTQKAEFDSYVSNVKICDPAIGSGAFPMGLLNELVKCRISLGAWAKDSNGNKLTGNIAALKREIISNNIYGVDIEKGAIDIARLRFWLSIIVDEQTPHTLPNFDYKFMQGNSLIPTFAGKYINVSVEKQVPSLTYLMSDLESKIVKTKQLYYNADGIRKKELNVKIKLYTMQMVANRLEYELNSLKDASAKQLSIFESKDKFNESSELVEKYQILDKANKLVLQLQDELAPIEQRNKIDIQFFDWTISFPEVMNVRDYKGNCVGGFDVVIANPPYVSSKVLSVSDKTTYKTLYKAADKQFDLYSLFIEKGLNLLCNTGVSTFIVPDSIIGRSNFSVIRSILILDNSIEKWIHLNNVFESAVVSSLIFVCKKCNSQPYSFNYVKAETVKQWKEDTYKTQLIDSDIVNSDKERKVIFAEQKKLNLQQKLQSAMLFKDYCTLWRGEEIGKKSELIHENKNANSFPLITGREATRYGIPISSQWIDLNDVAKSINNYKQCKVLIRQVGECINATLDTSGGVTTQSVYALFPNEESHKKHIKALVGILNSKLFDFFYRLVSGDKQIFKRIILENIKVLPYPDLNSSYIHVLDDLVDSRLNNVNNHIVEQKIDTIVYQIYGLTFDEVLVVDPKTALTREEYENFIIS